MYNSYEIDEYEKYNKMVNKFKKNNIKSTRFFKKWIKVDYSNLKINDIVIIYFYPDSQKYLYSLYPKAGKVIKINNDNDINMEDLTPEEKMLFSNHTIENITIKPFNNKKYANDILSHDWLGYFGNSRSYDYEIYKLTKVYNSWFSKKENRIKIRNKFKKYYLSKKPTKKS